MQAVNMGSLPGPDAQHPYSRRMLGSPCPAIATMINHSYLTPDGVEGHISTFQLAKAMVECFNLSWSFSILFAAVGILRLGGWSGFNIRQLGVHGKIEHDASYTRFDVSDGDALNPNAGIIEEFLRAATTRDAGGVHLVTLEDFARKQVSLMGKVLFFPIEQPRWLVYALGQSEACLALLTNRYTNSSWGNQEITARADWLRVWFVEERLPVELGWRRPANNIGLSELTSLIGKMKEIQEPLRGFFG